MSIIIFVIKANTNSRGSRPLSQKGILGMTLNCIQW